MKVGKRQYLTMEQIVQREGGLRVIPGHPGYYAAQSGNIYGWSARSQKYLHLTTYLDTYGFHVVQVQVGEGYVPLRVHKLIALTWLPKPSKGQKRVHFKDGNKGNCSAENLQWYTSGKYIKKGRSHKLTPRQVEEIRRRYAAGNIGQAELARQYSVHYSTIHLLVKNKRRVEEVGE